MDASTPLQGLTFLNTRDSRSAGQLTEKLDNLGARVIECPTIEFIAPTNWKAFDRRLEMITQDDWIVFTSANAVRATMERLWELNRPPGVLTRARIAVIGQGTANVLAAQNIAVSLMPGVAQQEALLHVLLNTLKRSDKVWIPRAQDAREILVEGLKAEGVDVTITPVYRTIMPKDGLGQAMDPLRKGQVDWMLFTSSSTVRHFFDLLDQDTLASLEHRWPQVACIGAVTAKAAEDHGLPVTVVPARQDLNGMVDAVVAYITGGGAPPAPPSGD